MFAMDTGVDALAAAPAATAALLAADVAITACSNSAAIATAADARIPDGITRARQTGTITAALIATSDRLLALT